MAAEPTADERAAVDALLGPPESSWDGAVERTAVDLRVARAGQDARDDRTLLLPALHALQGAVGWISPGGMNYVCERLMVPNAHRKVHGALLDAELLAEVYLGLTRGQGSFEIALQAAPSPGEQVDGEDHWPPAGLVVLRATEAEIAAHDALLDTLAQRSGKAPLWRRAEAVSEALAEA